MLYLNTKIKLIKQRETPKRTQLPSQRIDHQISNLRLFAIVATYEMMHVLGWMHDAAS
jgi:hypothetical protein